jgi:hypothetical protein
VPGRYAVAIVVAASLPFIFSLVRRPISPVLGLVVLTVIPSLLAKLVFFRACTVVDRPVTQRCLRPGVGSCLRVRGWQNAAAVI